MKSFILSVFGLGATLQSIYVNAMPTSSADTDLFDRKPNSWTPSPEFLAVEKSRMELKFILDPITNTTIPNPDWDTNITPFPASNTTKLGKRQYNIPYGPECRISFEHQLHNAYCNGYPPVVCNYGSNEVRVYNHQNTNERYAVWYIEGPIGSWKSYTQSGKRTFWAAANFEWSQLYGYNWVVGNLDGRWYGKNFMGGDYCWYSSGEAWWGFWGTASCSVWCSDFYP